MSDRGLFEFAVTCNCGEERTLTEGQYLDIGRVQCPSCRAFGQWSLDEECGLDFYGDRIDQMRENDVQEFISRRR